VLEPDEDEDPSRLCAVCSARPRWSKHGNCTRCAVCAGPELRKLILHRKKDQQFCTVPAIVRIRERYHALRRLGATIAEARSGSQGVRAFEAARERLSVPFRSDRGR
jgi:hypothetical protein